MSISILILTLNEEGNLPRCLDSVKWSDDIVILDSGSTDRTIEIAQSYGARVIHRKFDDWSSHQNWAVKNIPFKYPWVYYSDADEIITPELKDEMLAAVNNPDADVNAYAIRRKNYFYGKWLKHCGMYPIWIVRLFRPDKIRWSRLVNPIPEIDGKQGRLENHFEHYFFSKGFNGWFDRHNKYSWAEAQESIKSLQEYRLEWGHFISRNPAERRRALKELSFRLPFRPTLRFLYMYFLRLGFLDGIPGLTYCRLMKMCEYMIVLKIKEIERREKGLPI